MFSIFKKVSDQQEVVLQDLTEEQLTQAAGGRDHDWKHSSNSDWDDHKTWMKPVHHKMHKMHHKMHKMHHNTSGSHQTWSGSNSYNSNSYGGHW